MKEKEILELIPDSHSNYDRVIFLENQNGLYHQGAACVFREFLIEKKIRHHIICNLSAMTEEQMIETAKNCLDTLVVFETTGVSESLRKMIQIFIHLTNNGHNFRFMELSMGEFQFYLLPEEVGDGCISYHNLECGGVLDESTEDWSLTQIKKK